MRRLETPFQPWSVSGRDSPSRRVKGEERMDVMGHDDGASEVVALAVEVMEAVGDDWGEARITQGAGAVRGVEVFFAWIPAATASARR